MRAPTAGEGGPAPSWWQRAVFYQVYPRSFADSTGNGVGDLPGIIQKLDYLSVLGVDAIWLSPFYPSPLVDCGYDVADYEAVDPVYGSLDDLRRLLDQAHQRGIRVIIDLVLNHTSDQHPWFLESRSSLTDGRRDWYVWRDGVDGGPPNDWLSMFGGSAWTYDEVTGQYYYHFFFKEQPDLNWRNPAVQAAMLDVVRFWLDLGVDGFRLDAINTIYEDIALSPQGTDLTLLDLGRFDLEARTFEERQAAERRWKRIFRHQVDQPEVHELMRSLRSVVDAYGDRVLVGETDDPAYYGSGDDELHLVFNFPFLRLSRLTAQAVRANQAERLLALPPGAWPCNTLGNHDTSRMLSRLGDGRHDDALARLAVALVLTLRGTPFLYNGEEIGMTDLHLADVTLFRDGVGIWVHGAVQRALGLPPDVALWLAASQTRDRCRTPMQWTAGPNAGFSPAGVETWLPVHPNHAAGVNVADQERDPDSLLSFYRRMVQVRRASPALTAGSYEPLQDDDPALLVFLRSYDHDRCLVALNLSGETAGLAADGRLPLAGRVLLSTHRSAGKTVWLADLALEPYEVLVLGYDAGHRAASEPGDI